ncbi:chemotaxis protein CheX [Serpentinicella sp. ANB-PHB4]|uniref:chemotaxis protein CheX n=1 Tax=Serpentinicella sp. ANB-PHB4 TaxID=3074076 RepID=UPI00285FCCB2|nr:chemotaxis protein CheX [Serpentinicella sp. ANB-PHB4]MDR5658715.1 chemotaxis protein CheX [Serpentinicella sp. ANB-PHB4]
MDVKIINPFIEAFNNVLPQLGFAKVSKGAMTVKSSDLQGNGVMAIVGLVGDVKGNVIYSMNFDNAKGIASKMMMGMPVENFDDMAQSAISELSNMLTGNASINLSELGTTVDISTPTLIYGEGLKVKAKASKVLCVEIIADDAKLDLNIAFE